MRSVAIVLLSSIVLAVSEAPQQAGSAASNRRPALRGTFTDEYLGRGVFSGTVSVDRFGPDRGEVVAVGRLLGVLAASNGDILGRVDQALTLPVSNISATCELLQLQLGPVDVPLNGIQLRLEKGVLGITTRDGAPAGELGERLCASAGIIGRTTPPAAVASVLNDVLSLINTSSR